MGYFWSLILKQSPGTESWVFEHNCSTALACSTDTELHHFWQHSEMLAFRELASRQFSISDCQATRLTRWNFELFPCILKICKDTQLQVHQDEVQNSPRLSIKFQAGSCLNGGVRSASTRSHHCWIGCGSGETWWQYWFAGPTAMLTAEDENGYAVTVHHISCSSCRKCCAYIRTALLSWITSLSYLFFIVAYNCLAVRCTKGCIHNSTQTFLLSFVTFMYGVGGWFGPPNIGPPGPNIQAYVWIPQGWMNPSRVGRGVKGWVN